MADNGMKKTLAAMERVKLAGIEAARQALVQGAQDVAATQRALAPKDTGDLADSIAVTLPGQTTPAYSQPGGSRAAGEDEVIVTAGNSDVRYPHLVEHGTSQSEAKPFFFVGYRLNRDRIKRKAAAEFRKAAKREWSR